MKTSSTYTPALPKTLLFIGAPGTGKTTFALQLPKVFLLDCDQNMGGPVRHLSSKGIKPNYLYDTPFTDSKGAVLSREKQYPRVIELIEEAIASPDVETIVIDSLTSLIELLSAHIINSNKKSLATKLEKPDQKFEFEEWHGFGNCLRRLIFEIKATGKRLVITAHIKVDKDELTKVLHKFINCPGATGNVMSGWFEESWEFYITTSGIGVAEKKTHKIRTSPEANSTNLGLKSAAGFTPTMDVDVSTILAKLS